MLERKENIIQTKAEAFTNRIIKMAKYLRGKKADHNIIDQVYRAGLSIGANIAESKFAQSTADFINKLQIALKEANETEFWLRKLHTAEFLSDKEFESIYKDADEIVSILVSIIATIKKKSQR